MTTVKNFCEHFLDQQGMFPEQIAEVMEIYMEHEINEPMRDRWNDDIEGYPPAICNITIFTLKSITLEWIDRNCPEAWFRPCFTPDPMETLDKMNKGEIVKCPTHKVSFNVEEGCPQCKHDCAVEDGEICEHGCAIDDTCADCQGEAISNEGEPG